MVSRGRSTPKAQKKVINANPHLENLRKRVANSPTGPGIYRWLDAKANVMYVGKAKNLRKRLTSYVQPKRGSTEGPWKQSFLLQVADFDVTVTNTELEALILETNLIKQLRPKYNVLMKDDKNHLFIRVTVREPFPRVEYVRRFSQDGAKYFGPYLNSEEVKHKLEAAQEALHYRACKSSLENLNKNPDSPPKDMRPCLEFQIDRCNGLCAGKITREEYQRRIDFLMDFLKGNQDLVKNTLKEEMQKAAADKKFERAAKLRNQLLILEGKKETGQLATDTTGEDSDVFGVAVLSSRAHVFVLLRRNGRLIGESHYALAGQAESVDDVLTQFLPQFYEDGGDIPETIVVSDDFLGRKAVEEWLRGKRGKKVEVRVPERGRKSHLLQLAEKNAREKARQHEAKWEAERANTEAALEGLQRILDLPTLPERIEGYDISHLGGTETVGSMVVIRNGKTANDHYRSFSIRTMKSGVIDDYRALKEVLSRRMRYFCEDLPAEEEQWKKQGIVFGKARKAELESIKQFMTEESKGELTLDLDAAGAKEFVVARNGETIIALARSCTHKNGLLELRSVLVSPAFRGKRLGQFLTRKLLRSIKKGKMYAICAPAMEGYYGEIGFRHVLKVPPVLEEKMKFDLQTHPEWADDVVLVWDASQNKIDPSFTGKPDLLVIDGGKGQLSAVKEVLDACGLSIPVIGLAKREEEVFVPNHSDPIVFPKDSPAKFLLMRLRDEAHRFANRLREKKGKSRALHSALDEIPGVGEETKKKLLERFGSLSGISEAADQELLLILNDAQLEAVRKSLGPSPACPP